VVGPAGLDSRRHREARSKQGRRWDRVAFHRSRVGCFRLRDATPWLCQDSKLDEKLGPWPTYLPYSLGKNKEKRKRL